MAVAGSAGQHRLARLRARGAVRIYALAATKQEMGVEFWESIPYEKSNDLPYVRTFDE